MTRDDADEIKAKLNDRLEEVLGRFWPGWKKHGKIAYCAPGGKGDLGSFQVYLGKVNAKYFRGVWVRSSAGIGGDELNLFAYGFNNGGSHHADKAVFDEARRFLGMDGAEPETDEQRAQREKREKAAADKRADDDRRAREHEAERQRNAAALWGEIVPISGTHAEAYLLDRGIPVPPAGWDACLGFHPRVIYDLDTSLSFPTLVCRVDDQFGDITAVWKIHLHPQKPSKAPVEKAKIGAGVAAGGAVQIGGVSAHVGLAEGVETALAARALIKYRFPVWAGLSTSGVSGFEPPLGVEHITSFPDGDRPWRKHEGDLVLAEPPGRAAVRKLHERMMVIGIGHDSQPEPAIRKDYLDIWVARKRLEERA